MNNQKSDPSKVKAKDLRQERFLRRFDSPVVLTDTGCAKPKNPIEFFDFRKPK